GQVEQPGMIHPERVACGKSERVGAEGEGALSEEPAGGQVHPVVAVADGEGAQQERQNEHESEQDAVGGRGRDRQAFVGGGCAGCLRRRQGDGGLVGGGRGGCLNGGRRIGRCGGGGGRSGGLVRCCHESVYPGKKTRGIRKIAAITVDATALR